MRYRVEVAYVRYPDPASLVLIREAGGLSKMTPEQRAGLTMKVVERGGFCDDVHAEALEHWVETGRVVCVSEDPEPLGPGETLELDVALEPKHFETPAPSAEGVGDAASITASAGDDPGPSSADETGEGSED